MTVDPRHPDPPTVPAAQQPAAYSRSADSGAAHPEPAYPPAGYPGTASPGAAWPNAAYPAAPYPAAPHPGIPHPGIPYPALPHARMLAASADRERAIDVLKAGFAEGRLTQAEYNDRVGRVYASRTYGELGALVSDLPAGPLGGPAHYQAGGYPVARRPVPGTSKLALASLYLVWAGIGLLIGFVAVLILVASTRQGQPVVHANLAPVISPGP